MNVFVACEYSATVRDAFLRKGHHAVSCDLLPTESTEWPVSTDPGDPDSYPELHHTGDVFDVLDFPSDWFPGGQIDLMVAHPPCTYLTNAGARWLYQYDKVAKRTVIDPETGQKVRDEERWTNMREGALFFRSLWEAKVPRIAVENPGMMGHARRIIGRGEELDPTQTVHPYQFGHMEQKGVALWLKNLPPLEPTENVYAEMMKLPYRERAKVHSMAPGPERGKLRSMFFRGMADAMADQWGTLA